jgi:Mrp family chromosome partitioning ATPase/capsular polysaccharide biosynthesis protein
VSKDLTSPAAAPQQPQIDGDAFDDRPGVLASLSRYRLVVVAVTLLAAAFAYVVSSQLPVRYQAQATLILRDPGAPELLSTSGGSTQNVDRQAAVAKQADIMTSTVVLDRARRLLGSAQPVPEIRKEVDIRPSKDLTGITVDARAGSAASAQALANAIGTAYRRVSNDRGIADTQQAIVGINRLVASLQGQIDNSPRLADGSLTPQQQALAGQISDLKQRQQDLATELAVSPSGVELFERAELPDAPSQPKPKLFALLGALLGAIGAGGWAWWAAARNQRAERREDPARILGAPLLGEIPRFHLQRPGVGEAMSSPPVASHAYHFIVASLEHELAGVGGTSVALTGVTPGDGTTTTALNIAIAAREQDRKVALIDADERSRGLSELCGLSELDSARFEPDQTPADADEYLARLAVTHSGIVLPVPANREPGRISRLLRPPSFRKALLSLGEQFDLVLIDTPALLEVSDAIPIARQADGVVLVVDCDVLLSDLWTIRDRLAFVDTPLLGYVFVRKLGRRMGARAGWRPSVPTRWRSHGAEPSQGMEPPSHGVERQLPEPAEQG